MSVVISLSKLLRLAFWLAAACVVIVALGDHGTSEVGSTPDTVVTFTPTAAEPAAGDGR